MCLQFDPFANVLTVRYTPNHKLSSEILVVDNKCCVVKNMFHLQKAQILLLMSDETKMGPLLETFNNMSLRWVLLIRESLELT